MATRDSINQIGKPTYTELLKSPLWQRKRLEIFDRDNFTCRCCKSNDKQLQVHHLIYKKDSLPEDHENEMLVTLCYDCHDFAHNELRKIIAILAFQVLSKGVDLISLNKKLDEL